MSLLERKLEIHKLHRKLLAQEQERLKGNCSGRSAQAFCLCRAMADVQFGWLCEARRQHPNCY